jgi:hypothetical protein
VLRTARRHIAVAPVDTTVERRVLADYDRLLGVEDEAITREGVA